MRGSRLVRLVGIGATVGIVGLVSVAPRAQQQGSAAPAKPLLGFTASGAEKELALEARFDAALKKENLDAWLKRLAARPHFVGSPYDKDNAEFMAGLFTSWGYETAIEQYDVLFPTPKVRVLELVGPTKFTAKLVEPPLKEDSTSGQTAEQLPVYNAYSADGDVTGDLVFVNYGVPADYELLERHGISVKGKIVIAKYGGSWRGIKPKVAAEHGAIGCLIYSDPRDDGYFQGDAYPKGAYRPDSGAQRGSVADMPVFPGDPLTPGVGATKDAKRLRREEAPTLMKIPVLPISYADALPLLRALEGPVAPAGWRGALPITYHLGPGPAKVHLKLEFDWKLAPIYNVVARLRGAELPDEWIIRGNHHDAWVNGAQDPVSGMVAVLEEARLLGELAKGGWKPKRTLVFVGWDGEEPGLLGSTEWVEHHAEELRKHAVVYINSDSNGRGFFGAGGSHALEPFVNQIARDVIDPQTKVSVLERAKARQILTGSKEQATEARTRGDLRLNALGSGSDYTPFLQHLGVASLDIGYGGENGGGSYHSIFDSIDHFTRFTDPGSAYGVALVQTGGRAMLRLANADLLPFRFSALSETIGRYVKDVSKLADDLREQTEETNRRIADRTFQLADDPLDKLSVPAPKSPVPFVNLAPVQNALARLEASAKAYDAAAQALTATGASVPAGVQKTLGEAIVQAERTLTSTEGLPRRPWFTHQIYAPGFYTGYGVKTLPGIREAIEERQWKELETQTTATAAAIERLAAHLDKATAAAKGGSASSSAQ